MKIDEKTYKAMPPDLQAIFRKLPNPGSEEVLAGFPETNTVAGNKSNRTCRTWEGGAFNPIDGVQGHNDSGSAARFFYCAKASRAERGDGNTHPTVKPLALMRYLVRLVTPPGGVVLDPFAGSGTTLLAAMQEGFDYIGCELSADYAEIARARLAAEAARTPLFIGTGGKP